ncbi:MAG: hypothetical protein V7756_19060, partial [Halopseudomonas sp.]|uniref:hypothetical protein n=1 Tax=Halopseudomonas sp. TaxID=2901191 RepID=UPI0030038FA7
VKEVEAIEPERYSPVKKTDRKIRTMSRPQTPQVTLEERTVRSTKTNRDGSKTGTATKVWVPVVR